MHFRTFKQNKLWRDKIVTFNEQYGSQVNWQRLDDAEYDTALRSKLLEEIQEVRSASTREMLLEELADMMEVISALCEVHHFTLQDIMDAKLKKYDERGGFAGRKYVVDVKHPADSPGEKYCLADPQKYPEIVE